MSISSVNPYLQALYAQMFANSTSTVGTSTSTDQSTSASSSVQGVSGLDSFELSAPPIIMSGYDSSGNATGGSSMKTDIKAFMDKVKNGTVTDDDIKKLQAELQQAAETSESTQTATSTSSSSTDLRADIKGFLGKVKDGSVTASDIQSMQAELQKAGPPPGPPPDAADNNGADSLKADIKSFLDKVKDGSVTKSDIQNIQKELQQAAQQSGSSVAHKHHQQDSDSGSSSSTGFGADLMSFLDKVANGTVTDSDLSSFQSELQQQTGSNS